MNGSIVDLVKKKQGLVNETVKIQFQEEVQPEERI